VVKDTIIAATPKKLRIKVKVAYSIITKTIPIIAQTIAGERVIPNIKIPPFCR
jgi:hypothetical protein